MYYFIIIVATLLGFSALAWMLLAPIWRFLDREEQVSEQWTKEALARRRQEQAPGAPGGDGAPSTAPDASAPDASANEASDEAKRPAPPES